MGLLRIGGPRSNRGGASAGKLGLSLMGRRGSRSTVLGGWGRGVSADVLVDGCPLFSGHLLSICWHFSRKLWHTLSKLPWPWQLAQ